MMRFPVFAYVDDREEDRLLFKVGFDRAGLKNSLVLLDGSQQAQSYLAGTGPFADRSLYPAPTILFVDYKMPEMDGIQLTHWIRGRPEFKKLIVIMFSGSGQQEDIETAYAAGVNAYIVKPSGTFRLSAALQTVHSFWCGLSSLPASMAEPAEVQDSRSHCGTGPA